MKHSLWTKLFAVLPFTTTQSVVQLPNKSASITSFDYLEEIAIVTDTIRPYRPGQISFQGSWWRAVCEQDVELLVDTTVCVVVRKNNTYIVKPLV